MNTFGELFGGYAPLSPAVAAARVTGISLSDNKERMSVSLTSDTLLDGGELSAVQSALRLACLLEDFSIFFSAA